MCSDESWTLELKKKKKMVSRHMNYCFPSFILFFHISILFHIPYSETVRQTQYTVAVVYIHTPVCKFMRFNRDSAFLFLFLVYIGIRQLWMSYCISYIIRYHSYN